MSNDQVLAELVQILSIVNKATSYHNKSKDLMEQAFSKLAKMVIEERPGWNQDKSEECRGLAIRNLVLALDSINNENVLQRMTKVKEQIFSVEALVRGIPTNSNNIDRKPT